MVYAQIFICILNIGILQGWQDLMEKVADINDGRVQCLWEQLLFCIFGQFPSDVKSTCRINFTQLDVVYSISGTYLYQLVILSGSHSAVCVSAARSCVCVCVYWWWVGVNKFIQRLWRKYQIHYPKYQIIHICQHQNTKLSNQNTKHHPNKMLMCWNRCEFDSPILIHAGFLPGNLLSYFFLAQLLQA